MGKTALLLLDLQQGILEQSAARSARIGVIYVRTCFRRGYPEISDRNSSSSRISSRGAYVEGDPSVDFPHSIAPLQDDIVVTKRRVSAFSGSDLEVVLRGLNADNLVILGLSTSGAVLSTVRQAADLDYSLTVLADLCIDPKPEAHKVLVEQVFPRQARVLGAEQWMGNLARAPEVAERE